MGTYKITYNEGDTPEIEMDGTFSMDTLQNILEEAKAGYYEGWYHRNEEAAKKKAIDEIDRDRIA
jgi:hypothetical protein